MCGLHIAAVVSAIIIAGLIGFGLRTHASDIPLASTCSAAISAACHPPVGDSEAYLFPVQWGEVSTDDRGIGHCSLTTARDVKAPEIGKLYR
jgi:hypothetical protein